MSNIDELEKLSELKNKGIITPEEFEQKKNALLNHSLEQNDFWTSPKSRTTYALLGFFLGLLGVHNFYLGRKIQGFFQLLPVILIIIGRIIGSRLLLVVAGIYLMVYIFAGPLWVALNLFLTNKDGQGRLMNRDGMTLCNVLGAILLVLIFVGPACGVLSIGRLAGYTMAMNRYRANALMDYAARCAVVAQVQGNVGQTPQLCSSILNEAVPKAVKGSVTVQDNGYNNGVVVKVTNVSKEVGTVLKDRFGEYEVAGVRLNYSPLSQTAEFTFRN